MSVSLKVTLNLYFKAAIEISITYIRYGLQSFKSSRLFINPVELKFTYDDF